MKLSSSKLANEIVMGDDDNDIEMALASRHAFIPTVTSSTMAQTIAQHGTQFTAMRSDVEGPLATEMVLQKILEVLDREDSGTPVSQGEL